MLNEVVNYLNCRPGNVYVDGTLGGCGHAGVICEKILPGGTFIGIDQDIDAISNAETVLKAYSSIIHLIHGNYEHLPEYLARFKIGAVDGILLDLGMSQHQIEDSGRGFSFNKDEPLDMRMDIRSPVTAEKLVNRLSQAELEKLFKEYGEERRARQIARHIIGIRQHQKIKTSKQLAQAVGKSVPGTVSPGHYRHHCVIDTAERLPAN